MPEYRDRVKALARRADTLSLGNYTLAEFNSVFAALIAVCAAHDHLCFLWMRAGNAYPLESAVLVRRAAEWSGVLSTLTDVAPDKCRSMVSDLTFSVQQSVDLHVYPLIPLDFAGETLAIAPPFPLHGRHDENILRVCSQRRQEVYDVTSLEKQSEMLAAVRSVGGRYSADGPIALPKPTPDIDLLCVAESCSTVVIAELKWIRKTVRPAEIPERDADVLKGVGQLESIRAFLAENPGHLRALGRLPNSLDQYEQLDGIAYRSAQIGGAPQPPVIVDARRVPDQRNVALFGSAAVTEGESSIPEGVQPGLRFVADSAQMLDVTRIDIKYELNMWAHYEDGPIDEDEEEEKPSAEKTKEE